MPENENHDNEGLNSPEVLRLIRWALEEDVGPGDVTSHALLDAECPARAIVVARAPLVAAGLPVAARVFREVDPGVQVHCIAGEGQACEAGQALLTLSGTAAGLLTAERVALNFIQRMCGVATLTAAYVKAAGPGVQVLDTRKTTPGWRTLEKYAVLQGGGTNHRFGLYDRVLIKDNHLVHARLQGEGSLALAVARAREQFPALVIEIETDTLEQVEDALHARPDWILLDNMSCDQLREAVALCRGLCKTEASGGVNLHSIGAIAQTGVDAISVGAITHSAVAVDIALDFVETSGSA